MKENSESVIFGSIETPAANLMEDKAGNYKSRKVFVSEK